MPDDSAKIYQFNQSSSMIEIDPESGKFSGVAYSGSVIPNHWHWGNVVFDLSNLQYKSRIGVLLEHYPEKRAGFADSISVDQKMVVSGELLDNEHGAAVKLDGKGGFPWEMSVYIEPGKIERFSYPVEVNGNKIEASEAQPITVFRDCRIREVSFCAIGADYGADAQVFNHQEGVKMPEVTETGEKQKAPENDLALQFSQMRAENAELKQQNEALHHQFAAMHKKARETAITNLFSAAGMEVPEGEELAAWVAMDERAFSAASGALSKIKPVAQHDESHLFIGYDDHAGNLPAANGGANQFSLAGEVQSRFKEGA